MHQTIIRSVREEDAADLLAIYRPYIEETAVTFEYEVPTVTEFAGRISSILAKYPYLVLEDGGQIQGYAYAGVFKGRAAFDWSCETTVYIERNHRKNGYGRSLYLALEDALRPMGMRNLYACIASPIGGDPYLTKDSILFHNRMGYRLCGSFRQCGYKFGRWYDMVWMEKMIAPHGDALPLLPPDREIFRVIAEDIRPCPSPDMQKLIP